MVQSLAPLLAGWIVSERDAAKAQGVEPIPAPIRAALAGYVPEPALDRVRWREGASELSLPQNVIRFGHVPAVTLDDVIVFQERARGARGPEALGPRVEARHAVRGVGSRRFREALSRATTRPSNPRPPSSAGSS